ncbi:AraC family transcriptional regulator [Mangrovihabitans endophyticus]|uniref:AraC family transcriptional regulator n=1 Tax=Mangrovihabitans endophyticus TaxID=1751298 RepID=A0A8J3BY39_9ACTN|nr:AraC family transcriptional regulator [Mangrovihabitans endophyticus]
MDPLNNMLTILDAEMGAPSRIEKTGSWAVRFDEYQQFRIGAVLRGDIWLRVDGGAPRRLSEGDCYLLGDGKPHVIGSDLTAPASDGDAETAETGGLETARSAAADPAAISSVVLTGSLGLDQATEPLLRSRIPGYVEMKSSSYRSQVARPILELLSRENAWEIPDADLMRLHLSRILLIQLVRTALRTADGCAAAPPDRLLTRMDERIRCALDLIHRQPSKRWTVANLAAAAHMSRSVFAARFRTAVGMPPLEYLEMWRIRSAAAVLQSTDRTVSSVAAQFGYSADSTFSRAFKRVTGRAPKQYRQLAA